MVEGLLAIAGALLNGGWATRLEAKTAGLSSTIKGNKEMCDERHEETLDTLKDMNRKLDKLLERR